MEIINLRLVFVQSPCWHCIVTNLLDSGLGPGAKMRRNLQLVDPNMLLSKAQAVVVGATSAFQISTSL